MGRRSRRSSIYPKHQTVKHLEDRISQLPDGILTHILSLLEVKEAGRSSVLSHRWRDLWKFTTRLNFDGSLLKSYLCKNAAQKRSKLVALVTQVVKLHLHPSLDEFTVRDFSLSSRGSRDIEEWMNFVMTKRVKILEIDLGTPSQSLYTPSQECYRSFKSPSNLSSIKCLTSLRLKALNLNGELIEYFLSNCPNLEQLQLLFIGQIVNLNVSGPSLQLKHLEIMQCKSLESLEFCAPKLVTFKYFGKPIRLSMGSLPLLAELGISAGYHHLPFYALRPFSSYLSQIETLTLSLWLPEDFEEFPRVPELRKLKHLMLEVYNGSRTFPCFTNLVDAAPSLHTFTFTLLSHVDSRAILSNTLTSRPRECLKDVEICGFFDREFVMYLLQIAINLEKITIDPYEPFEDRRKYRKEKEELRKRAHQLSEILPSGVKLTVL